MITIRNIKRAPYINDITTKNHFGFPLRSGGIKGGRNGGGGGSIILNCPSKIVLSRILHPIENFSNIRFGFERP